MFFQFENDDWEKELMAFNNTDVEVPATLTVDGKVYKDVGVHFRGASSFIGVPEGLKHSINVVDGLRARRAGGAAATRTLNLLNSHDDPTYLRTVLYLQAAREYMPAPKANYVRVVINGESWGIYVERAAVQQGVRQRVVQDHRRRALEGARQPGRARRPRVPRRRSSRRTSGSTRSSRRTTPKAWADLVLLCKTLNTTPPEQLEKALAPMLDIDGALKFLALDIALVNSDGYWTRASDYSIYQDPKGVFHVLPHDANETFGPGGGRGMGGPGPDRGGPGGRAAGPADCRHRRPGLAVRAAADGRAR